MTCRWDRAAQAHLTREHLPECVDRDCKGCRPCTHDGDGNPVRHCRTRLRCTSHLDWHEHTCTTCLGKIRTNMRRLLDALALMPNEATEAGIDSQAATLAGPHADAETYRRRMIANAARGLHTEEPDQYDPWQMLGIRERMIREDLGHADVTLTSETLAGTCSYLDWVLTDLARDPDQVSVLAELLRETGRLADHAEAVLHDSRKPERGIPCPECVVDLGRKRDELQGAGVPEDEWPKSRAPRLVRHHGHWCQQDGCRQVHYLDDSGDVWRCPDNEAHEWTHADYEARLVGRRGKRERMGA